MQRNLIEKLGDKAIVSGIDPLIRPQRNGDPIVGFDTEYDAKRRLICWQLANGETANLHTGALTLDNFGAQVRALSGADTSAWIITFWSYAELQFFPTLTDSFDWRLYAAGSFDCSFVDSTGFILRFFDLARFFERSSLARVAESFGEKKLEYDVTRVTKRSLRDPKFREYAKHDAYLCWRIMDKMRAEFLPLGADPLVAKTAAGLSATVFRRNYLDVKVRCETPKARVAGMHACWGGRAEVFRRGRFAEVYEYDLESAYPNAALAIKGFPVNGDLKERGSITALLKGKGFARVIFKFPDDTEYPCLPCISSDCQVYPLRGISWATTFEIQRAIDLGAELELLEGWSYTGGTTALAEMMQWALEIRKTSTGAKNMAAKLIANAMIGKLAQRRSGVDIEEMRDICKRSGVSIHDVIRLNGHELESLGLHRKAKVGSCFMPEWNALITGYVRAQLHELICEGQPIYCATDSVWTTKRIRERPGLGLKRAGKGIVVRTRLAALFAPGKTHIAHHSIWSRDAALKGIETYDTEPYIDYPVKRAIKLKESLRRRIRIATFVEELRRGDFSWDHKRELLKDGTTRPWRSIDEQCNARKRWRDERRKR